MEGEVAETLRVYEGGAIQLGIQGISDEVGLLSHQAGKLADRIGVEPQFPLG